MRTQVTEYVHANREELSPLWKPDAPQQEVFHYTLYELRLDCDVDLDTGHLYIRAVNGVPLESAVEA